MEYPPLLISFVNSLFQTNRFVVKLSTNVNVSSTSVHGVSSNQTTFDESVGVLTDNLTILASSRLGLIAVHHQEVGTTILGGLGHETPLQAGGESSSSTSTETGSLDISNNLIRSHLQQLLGLIPESTLDSAINVIIEIVVEIGKHTIIILSINRSPLPNTFKPP